MTKQTNLQFFEARIFRPATPCWNWRSYINRKGYGTWRRDGRNTYVHRVAYELLIGPIPDGFEVHHKCCNRSCVNPAHLQLVTHDENIRLIGRSERTHCVHGHELTPENTAYNRGRRVCRECRNTATRKINERKRRELGRKEMAVECKNGHPRTPENTVIGVNGRRRCRDCELESREQRRRAAGAKSWTEKKAARTHCAQGHELTEENTYVNPKGYRGCRTCNRESSLRRYYARKGA